MLVSVIITTYNRVDALKETLSALNNQTLPPEQYEILVVDNGSIDSTSAFLSEFSPTCGFRYFRLEQNQGISAGRNTAIRHAAGEYLIMVSDDLIVPPTFIATHLETHEQFPNCWVVGGFQQLDSLALTPFGRYLDGLERHWETLRKSKQLGTNIWEMGCPTARNISIRRADLEKIGLFDEQFSNSCEDQDLAHRASEVGIRFIYNANITCLHNDQVGDFRRFVQTQRRCAHDGVLFCAKYAEIHGGADLVKVNGYISKRDGVPLALKKLLKSILALKPVTRGVEIMVAFAELFHLPEKLLYRIYHSVTGIYIFRGWREGLKTLKRRTLSVF